MEMGSQDFSHTCTEHPLSAQTRKTVSVLSKLGHFRGTSLVVQWLGLWAYNAGAMGLIDPWLENSYMPWGMDKLNLDTLREWKGALFTKTKWEQAQTGAVPTTKPGLFTNCTANQTLRCQDWQQRRGLFMRQPSKETGEWIQNLPLRRQGARDIHGIMPGCGEDGERWLETRKGEVIIVWALASKLQATSSNPRSENGSHINMSWR